MAKALTTFRRLMPLALSLFVLTGCGKGGCTRSSSSSFEVDINGRKTSWKTIKRTENGVTRILESTADVDVQNGQIIKFPPLAVIKLEEIGGDHTRVAELRENGGKLELWIKDSGSFRSSTPEEDAWLKTFLIELTK